MNKKGDILVSVIIFAAIAITVIIGLTNWGAAVLSNIRNVADKEQAFQIAEAGLDYYRWHLAQSPNDYNDGTTTPGPYIHQFNDKDGNHLGQFSLTITPPLLGSTIVKIVSVGTLATSSISRTLEARMAIISLAKYAVVSNDNMRFGVGTEVFGPIQVNGGIRFDGVAHNLVSSAMAQYNDTDPDDCNIDQSYGVHTCVDPDDPSPPTAVPNRSDVFVAGRQFPVPAVDFAGLTAGLTQLQILAQPAAGGKEWLSSGKKGYHIVFKVNGSVTVYDIYKVNSTEPPPTTGSPNCGADNAATHQLQWGTWSIKGKNPNDSLQPNQTLVASNQLIPANGVIFVDDHVWVDGHIQNTRVTVAAGIIGNTDPTKNANITVNSDLTYSNYNGTDAIGLIAQGNINVGMLSDDNLQIDAALVAEKGRAGRFYYNNNCTNSSRASITLNGMIATYIRYGFAYTDSTGYNTRNINYDANLLYGPPPSFPQATSQYQVISWKQI